MNFRNSYGNRQGYVTLLVIIAAALVVTNMLNYGTAQIGSWLLAELMMLPGILIGLCFHEFGHAVVSNALGDPTPKSQGRLTLKPTAHLDLVGFLCLLFAGFGWGVPVEIDPRYYKNKRSGEFLVSIAGVVMNLIVALAAAVGLHFLVQAEAAVPLQTGGISWQGLLYQIMSYIISINVTLMIFNLMPIPPLDGFGILTQIFNLRRYSWYDSFQRWGIFLLLALVLFNIIDIVLIPITSGLTNLIFGHIVY